MRYKISGKSISAILISAIILSIFFFNGCGKDEEESAGAAVVVGLDNGEAVDVSSVNGKTIYTILSYEPADKPESDSGPSAYSTWYLSLTAGKSAPINFMNLVKSISEKSVYSSKQTDMDQRMRESENKTLSSRSPQFSRKTAGRESRVPGIITVGTTWTGVYILTDTPYPTISTTCQYISDHAYFFVDDRDAIAMSSLLADYGTAFDAIYDVNHSHFGTENDVDSNGKVIIVFTRELTGGILGYFYSGDKYAYTSSNYSNEGDIFYMTIDAAYQGDIIKGTLAHEFQHMIYYDEHSNRSVLSTRVWLNEALSQAAEHYNGFYDNHNKWIYSFLRGGWAVGNEDYPLSLTHWTKYNYGYGAIFIRYLIDQYGDTAIKNMCSTNLTGIAAVEGATGDDFNTIFNNFTRALAIAGTGDSCADEYKFTTLDVAGIQPVGRGGLIPYSDILSAGYIYSGEIYPYSITFLQFSGSFSTMILSGTGIEGTALGLSK